MSDEVSMIIVMGHKVGMISLSAIFENLKQKNVPDDPELKNQLLKLVRVQNYVPDSRVDDYAQALLREFKKSQGLPVEKEGLAVTSIRILGPGCTACETMEKNVRAILSELNIPADVEHVRDINQIAEYGIVRTPSLVINDEIVLNGRSLSKAQLKTLIEERLKKNMEEL